MPRVISDKQKQLIRNSLPDTITIGNNSYHASKLWSNQKITSYPVILCNISNDGINSGIEDIVGGTLYHSCILTIHILDKTVIGKDNGAVICETFSQQIVDEITTWTDPLKEDVRIFNPRDDLKSVGYLGFQSEIFDYVISVTLYHS